LWANIEKYFHVPVPNPRIKPKECEKLTLARAEFLDLLLGSIFYRKGRGQIKSRTALRLTANNAIYFIVRGRQHTLGVIYIIFALANRICWAGSTIKTLFPSK
jgi:hypothetical protein